jgi:hypothetical protein
MRRFPAAARESEWWRLTRSRHSDAAAIPTTSTPECAKPRSAMATRYFGPDSRSRKFQNHKTFLRLACFPRRNRPRHCAFSPRLHFEEETMGRGLLLWLLGVPIPVILLLWLFFGR